MQNQELRLSNPLESHWNWKVFLTNFNTSMWLRSSGVNSWVWIFADWLRAPNSEELIRDLAITSKPSFAGVPFLCSSFYFILQLPPSIGHPAPIVDNNQVEELGQVMQWAEFGGEAVFGCGEYGKEGGVGEGGGRRRGEGGNCLMGGCDVQASLKFIFTLLCLQLSNSSDLEMVAARMIRV